MEQYGVHWKTINWATALVPASWIRILTLLFSPVTFKMLKKSFFSYPSFLPLKVHLHQSSYIISYYAETKLYKIKSIFLLVDVWIRIWIAIRTNNSG
jgi:hypothetical protein